jgi:hypothetical protein
MNKLEIVLARITVVCMLILMFASLYLMCQPVGYPPLATDTFIFLMLTFSSAGGVAMLLIKRVEKSLK